MMHSSKDGEILWIYSMGKRFQVRCIATEDAEANRFMEKNSDTAVIACFGEFIIIANVYEGVR